MFGVNKLKEAQKKAEEIRTELASMTFKGESLNGLAKAECSGAKVFSSVTINEDIYGVRAKEEVEQMLVEAVNEALQNVEITAREKLISILPDFPGLNL